MGMILRIASSRIVGQADIVGRSGYFSLNLSANSVMRGRLDARRTLKSLVADLRINNYRKIVRDQTYVDQTDNLFHLNLPQDSGFESTEGAYDLKEMHRVVNALPKEYKVPFSMHVSGFKYREIAEKLELPLGTVKSRIFFTRQRLQQELKDFV